MFTSLKTKNSFQENPQIFDLLQLSRKERDCKIICTRAIRQFEEWQAIQKKYVPFSLNITVQIEGILRRRRARRAILFYKMVKGNRMKAFQKYMEQLPQRQTALYSAS